MANTLTGLIPTLYSAWDIVARELIGFIPHVDLDVSAAQAAVGQTVRSPVVPVNSLENITPGATPADSGDQTIGYTDVSITNSKAYPIRWTGEEQLSVSQFGVVNTILRDQFAQGMRVIANAVEGDLAALYATTSRAYGTAGTAPFGTASDMTDWSGANRILDENGAPASGRVMILGHAARYNLEGKQSQLFKVNESGDGGDMLRNRLQRQLMGFMVGHSGGIVSHTKGTATGHDINKTGGYAVGDTSINFNGMTAGATGIKAGDVITFAGDTNKYVVTTGDASGTDGTIVLGAPGLLVAAADAVEMTTGNSYTANMFFHEKALKLVARQPAMPVGGDSAEDVTSITDPVSGLTFQVALYKQYKRIKYEIGLAWGVKNVMPRYTGILMG